MREKERNTQLKIVLISDHAGFPLKKDLIRYFNLKEYLVKDLGPEDDSKPIAYSSQGIKLGKFIAKKPDYLGVAICGSGLGISMGANRVKGARSARITSIADAKVAKKHNNANILSIGGRITTTKKAVDMFNAFIREDFEGGRHIKRIEKLDK